MAIVDRRGFAFGMKWIAAGAVGIGAGVWSYLDKALSDLGIGWKLILAGCIMLPIGIAVVIGACREPESEQPIADSSPPVPVPGDADVAS